MKLKNVLPNVLTLFFLVSCVSPAYYQVYKTQPVDNITSRDNLLVYDDQNCSVIYNLWQEGGSMGFRFYNKTDQNIYLKLDQSFFILNGVSYNYYKNRVFTTSTSSGASASRGTAVSKAVTGINYLGMIQTNQVKVTSNFGVIASSGFSTAYNEEMTTIIPGKSSKIISEYSINTSLFRDCDLFKYPTKKQVKSKSFAKSESPFVFSNRLAYSVGQTEELVKFENEFYVTEISNYPESEIIELKKAEFCEQKSMATEKYFKDVAPNKFYIRYVKGQDFWKH